MDNDLSQRSDGHLARLVRIRALAERVWEDPDAAAEFLRTSHPLLDGRSPLELAESDDGAHRVEALLLKLEYSMPA